MYVFFYLIEQHSKFLLHTLQVLYMCTLCDSTNINTIIEFVLRVSGDCFNGGSDWYLQFRDRHAPSLFKLCIPPSNGIVRWWLFPEFGAELLLENCTPKIVLNNSVYKTHLHRRWVAITLVINDASEAEHPLLLDTILLHETFSTLLTSFSM